MLDGSDKLQTIWSKQLTIPKNCERLQAEKILIWDNEGLQQFPEKLKVLNYKLLKNRHQIYIIETYILVIFYCIDRSLLTVRTVDIEYYQ